MKEAKDILADLTSDNIINYISLSKSLLGLYGDDSKYEIERKELLKDLSIIEEYYAKEFSVVSPIFFEDLERKFNNICQNSGIHSTTISVKTEVNNCKFKIYYKSNACDIDSFNFRDTVLNPKIDKTILEFSKYLKDNDIKYAIDTEPFSNGYAKSLKIIF